MFQVIVMGATIGLLCAGQDQSYGCPHAQPAPAQTDCSPVICVSVFQEIGSVEPPRSILAGLQGRASTGDLRAHRAWSSS